MSMNTKSIIYLTFILFIFISFGKTAICQNNWPQWRGLNNTGAAIKGNPPTEFSETKNLKWKTSIPGKGHATPIVWGDKIIIETAVPKDAGSVDMEEWRQATATDLVLDYKVILLI